MVATVRGCGVGLAVADRDRAVEVRAPPLGAGQEPRTGHRGEGRAHRVVHASSQARVGPRVSAWRRPSKTSSRACGGR